MPTFKRSFIVQAPVDAVAEFHNDPRALKLLNPPGIFVQLHRADPLGEGSESEFTLWFGPFPVRWRAVHSDVTAHGFVDRQASGPAETWVHTHRYQAQDPETTLVTDSIVFEHKKGWRGWLTRLLFAPINLKILFGYRAWATRRAVRREFVRG